VTDLDGKGKTPLTTTTEMASMTCSKASRAGKHVHESDQVRPRHRCSWDMTKRALTHRRGPLYGRRGAEGETAGPRERLGRLIRIGVLTNRLLRGHPPPSWGASDDVAINLYRRLRESAGRPPPGSRSHQSTSKASTKRASGANSVPVPRSFEVQTAGKRPSRPS